MHWPHSWEREIKHPRDPREGKHTSNGRNLPQNGLGLKALRTFAAINNSGAATGHLAPLRSSDPPHTGRRSDEAGRKSKVMPDMRF